VDVLVVIVVVELMEAQGVGHVNFSKKKKKDA